MYPSLPLFLCKVFHINDLALDLHCRVLILKVILCKVFI